MKKMYTVLLVLLSINCGFVLKNISYGETTVLNYLGVFIVFLAIIFIAKRLQEY